MSAIQLIQSHGTINQNVQGMTPENISLQTLDISTAMASVLSINPASREYGKTEKHAVDRRTRLTEQEMTGPDQGQKNGLKISYSMEPN